jgi:single-stranded DNA-specific DHH superfamily exonuclease
MAAGMRLDAGSLAAFTQEFTRVCNQAIAPEMLAGRASFDCDARIGELSQATVRTLDTLGPFGRDNPRICLRLRGVRINGRPNTMGRDNSHMFFFVSDAASPMISMRVIAWRGAELIRDCPSGGPLTCWFVPLFPITARRLNANSLISQPTESGYCSGTVESSVLASAFSG